MSQRLLNKTFASIALCIGVLNTFPGSVSGRAMAADPSQGVVRRFLVLTNLPYTGPNFLSSNSRLLLVPGRTSNANEPNNALKFDNSFNCDPTFNGTDWFFRDVFHIGTGRQIVRVAFEGGVPPNGAFTFTGPNSPRILDQKLLWIKNGYETGHVRLHSCSTPGGSGAILVVTAVFSK